MSMDEVRMLVPTPASDHVLLGPETGMDDMGYRTAHARSTTHATIAHTLITAHARWDQFKVAR
jgi:hypothetical protein